MKAQTWSRRAPYERHQELWTSSASNIGRVGQSRFFSTVVSSISAILFAVRKLLLAGLILLAAGASVVIARGERASNSPQPAQPHQDHPTPQAVGSQESGNQQPPSQIVPPAATHPGLVVILNPAHGGADTGARG